MPNVNGTLKKLEGVLDAPALGPSYIAARDWLDAEQKLAELPEGARCKLYLGGFSPDDWDEVQDEPQTDRQKA